jgi:nitrogen fixation protein FixH
MNCSTVKSSRNPWPCAIIAWFALFISAMAAWMTVAMRQQMDLVRSDYYEEEVRFQRQLDRLNRTAPIRNEISIRHDRALSVVTLRLPNAHLSPQPSGRIHFYRPSDAALDFEIPLAVDAAGLQCIGTQALRGGLWKIRAQWNTAGHDYFFEEGIVVDEAGSPITAPPTKTE